MKRILLAFLYSILALSALAIVIWLLILIKKMPYTLALILIAAILFIIAFIISYEVVKEQEK